METFDSTDKKTLRNFGLLMGGMFALLFGLVFPWISGKPNPLWPFYLLGGFWFLALLIPNFLAPVHWFWMKLGHYLGWINSRIILGILFFFLFTPLAWLLTGLGKNPIGLRAKSAGNYRIFRNPKNKINMEVPY
jgi:hypothetical protein